MLSFPLVNIRHEVFILFVCTPAIHLLNHCAAVPRPVGGDGGVLRRHVGVGGAVRAAIHADASGTGAGETITLSYSLLYINKISEFSSISKEAGISISNKWPLKVLYKLDDKYDENSKETSNYIEFHVAPSIEE